MHCFRCMGLWATHQTKSKIEDFWLRKNEYAYRIPNPEHTPKYTKVKVLCTQDKHCVSWAASQSYICCCCHIKGLAAVNLPEYVATYLHPTGYLHPGKLDRKKQTTFSWKKNWTGLKSRSLTFFPVNDTKMTLEFLTCTDKYEQSILCCVSAHKRVVLLVK